MYIINRFEGRVVAVTGGAKGIGKACCLRFAQEGAAVAVLDVALADAEQVAQECAGVCGQPARAYRCDVADEKNVEEVFAAIAADFGGLDVLVASAGIYSGQPLTEVPLAAWQRLIDINLTGVFLTNKAAAGLLREGGSIINISSMAGKTSWPASAQYSASKSGVIGLTRSVAMELVPNKVTVNAVCPGNTKTDMPMQVARTIAEREGFDAEAWAKQREQDCPLKRWAEVEEIAGVVSFLASPDAAYITGQAIEVDGGMVMS